MKHRFTFQEAIEAVKNDPGTEFLGAFMQGSSFFGLYNIRLTEDEPDEPREPLISYEGGYFFSSEGEEDTFLEEDATEIAKALIYKISNNLPDLFWCQAEVAAYKLLKDIPDPDTLLTREQRADFAQHVRESMQAKWTVFG